MDCSTPGFPVLHHLPELALSIVSISITSIKSNHLFLCHPLLLLPSIFSSIRVFFNELMLLIRWPKYQSFIFSISPSNEYSGLTSLRIGLITCSPKDSQVFSPTPQFKSINSSVLSLFYGPTLTSIYDYWKNHCFDYRDICQQKSTLESRWLVQLSGLSVISNDNWVFHLFR